MEERLRGWRCLGWDNGKEDVMQLKKIVALVTAFAMLIPVAGCSEKEKSSSSVAERSLSGVRPKGQSANQGRQSESDFEDPENYDDEYYDDAYDDDDYAYDDGDSSQTADSGEFSLDAIADQCSACRELLEYRISLIKATERIVNYDPERATYIEAADELQSRIYNGMQHSCTAPSYYVENFPVLIGSREGEYTGYWKGAGPSGQGTFVGKDIYTNHLDNIVYQYTGEWQYGLPCGSGMQMFSRNDELYQFATVYAGDFSAGEPNGYGTLYRKSWEGNDVYYEEAYFQDGALVGQTNFVEYDSNGKYLGAGIAEDGGGDQMELNVVSYYKSVDVKEALAVAGICAAAVLGGAYLLGGGSSSSYGTSAEQQMAELQRWRDDQTASNEAEYAAQEEREEQYKQYCRSRYEELHKADSSDWSLDSQYYKANMD